MSSKQVLDRQRIAAAVEAAMNVHGGTASGIAEDRLRKHAGPSETEPGVHTFVRRLRKSLTEARLRLVRADEAHIAEIGDDAEPRRRRDEAAAEVYFEIANLRAVCKGLFGAVAGACLLGVRGRTAEDPLTLYRQARRILRRLRDPDTRWPPPRVAGMSFDSQAWIATLQPKVEGLNDALREVYRQRRAAETTLVAKQEAMRHFDTTYQAVARMTEGLFALTGAQDLAARVRPTRRKLRRENSESPAPETSLQLSAASSGAMPQGPVLAPLTLVPAPPPPPA